MEKEDFSPVPMLSPTRAWSIPTMIVLPSRYSIGARRALSYDRTCALQHTTCVSLFLIVVPRSSQAPRARSGHRLLDHPRLRERDPRARSGHRRSGHRLIVTTTSFSTPTAGEFLNFRSHCESSGSRGFRRMRLGEFVQGIAPSLWRRCGVERTYI